MQSVAIELSDETDVGLLLLIGGAADTLADQTLAREALRELHTRHYGYVLGVLERYAENAGTLAIDPKEWASKTFVKAFQNAGSFSDRTNENGAPVAGQVRAWLGVIARNAALDEIDRLDRQQRRLPVSVLEDCHVSAVAAPLADDIDSLESESPTPPAILRKLREFLASLKPAERDIVMAYAEFGEPTASGRELPPEVRAALERSTGYERSNIRQKWRRLSQRLKTELEPHFPARKPLTLHV